MELILIRHAIAGKRRTRRHEPDAARPLSPRGIRRFRRAAGGLGHIVESPELVLSSPLLRARQTAAILCEVAGWPEARIAAVLAPGHESREVLARLAKCDVTRLAVVGHEPDLGRLLAHCLPGGMRVSPVEFRKGAAACVCFGDAIGAGQGTLRWLLPPRVLRKLADRRVGH